jgi:Spermidine synthase
LLAAPANWDHPRYALDRIAPWPCNFPYRRSEAHFEHASRPYERDDQGHVLARVVKRIEGTSDTWQLLRRDLFGQAYYYRLLSDSFSMSATSPRNQRYMRLFAYLPLALNPGARDVLLICYGCGVTADAFTRKSSVERVDIVDISKEVFSLADSYAESITPTRFVIRACTPSFKMGGFSYRRARENTTSSRANRHRRKTPAQ